MASINLSKISATVEDYMIDTVVITRRSGTISIDPGTLRANETLTSVYMGKAMIGPQGSPVKTVVGSAPTVRMLYEVGIPVSAPEVEPNDIIQVAVSADPQLKEVLLFVEGIIPSTFFTHRRILCRRDVADDG